MPIELPFRKGPQTNYVLATRFRNSDWYVRGFGNKLMDFTKVQRFAQRYDLQTAVTLQSIFVQRGHQIRLVAIQCDRLQSYHLLPPEILLTIERPALPDE